MADRTAPFAAFEWQIAWAYLKARKREGGVSVMSVISLVGVSLAVFALIATLAVRSGFRAEFVATILGANAHATVYSQGVQDEFGFVDRSIKDYDALVEQILAVPGVTRAAPLVKAQVMASSDTANAGVQVFGERLEDVRTIPLIVEPEQALGDLDRFDEGVAIGSGLARSLGLALGDVITLISPDGVQTAFGTSPRVNAYEIVYIFQVGRYDIDSTRVYMPLAEAQDFFNHEDTVTELEIFVEDPEKVIQTGGDIAVAAGFPHFVWTWQEASGSFLRALKMEDNIMFIILSILVMVATLNIVSGLIMLVKNKGRDIGILRTMGLSEGSILRIFFICGASIGVAGTVIGVVTGCLFAIYIDPIFNAVNWMLGGDAWDPSVRYLSALPAKLEWGDVFSAMALSLGLSFTITYFPARRAARLNPVEALRYE